MDEVEPKAAQGVTLVQTIIAGVILTVLAGVAGGALGWMQASGQPQPVPAPVAEAAEAEEPAEADEVAGPALRLVPLAPVFTNLDSNNSTWLRIEANLVLGPTGEGIAVDDSLLAAQVQADTLAFLRSVQLAQIDGTRGLLHLAEDLKERARQRSPAVVDYLIHSLVAE